MRRYVFGYVVGLAAVIWPWEVAAQDRAVLLSSETAETSRIGPVATALSGAGFEVVSGSGLTAAELERFARLILEETPDGRRVVLVEGRILQDGAESWLLGRGAAPATRLDLVREGLPLSVLLAHLAKVPGGAVLAIATTGAPDTGDVAGLAPGPGKMAVPQGVTLATGEAAAIARFAEGMLTKRGLSLADMAAAAPDVTIPGFVGGLAPFRPAEATSPATPTPITTATARPTVAADAAAWAIADAADTEAAYTAYLAAFPAGAQAEASQTRIKRLQETALLTAAEQEWHIGLSRDQRRDLQRALGRLGHPTRGIDGVFGRYTRAAIRDWQEARGLPMTGFLSQDQALWILESAVAPTAAVPPAPATTATEATRPSAQTATTLPENAGTLAEAPPAPAVTPAAPPPPATPELAYLRRYPDGLFAEAALALDGPRRQAINARLTELELLQDAAGDTFTDGTRAALKLFQETNGLAVTGFVNRETWWALLSGALEDTPPGSAISSSAAPSGG